MVLCPLHFEKEKEEGQVIKSNCRIGHLTRKKLAAVVSRAMVHRKGDVTV